MSSLVWNFKKGYYRCYQSMIRIYLTFVKYPQQQLIARAGGITSIPSILKENNFKHICLICSKSIRKNGLLNELITGLEKEAITYSIFENIHPNTTTEDVEEGYKVYRDNKCEAIIAVGGGSVMDCAKIIGIKISNPDLNYQQMKHMSAIKKPIPFLVAVPTTAGTGSESSIGCVVTDKDRQEKFAIVSFHTMPRCVILDENLTIGLPKDLTAYTGMDALTHAIEAYIGNLGTNYTNSEALQAIKLIFDNLETVYTSGYNKEARKNMLTASNHAANAFTRAYTGYVHNISHALSALYDVGHGKTNAIILPYMLRFYGKSIEKKLSEIAIYTGLDHAGDTNNVLTHRVIERIEKLNKAMNIPSKVRELQHKDLDIIVKKALMEGNPAYPVPRIMNYEECFKLVKDLMP